MKEKQHKEACEFMPKTRLGQVLKTNLSWNEKNNLHHRQMIAKDGVIFDLDKDGRIIRMIDSDGQTYETKEVKKLFL